MFTANCFWDLLNLHNPICASCNDLCFKEYTCVTPTLMIIYLLFLPNYGSSNLISVAEKKENQYVFQVLCGTFLQAHMYMV